MSLVFDYNTAQDQLLALRQRVAELEDRTHQYEDNALIVAGQQCLLEMIAKSAPLAEILEAIALFAEERSRDLICSILILNSEKTQLRRGASPSLPASFADAVDGLIIGPEVGSCGTAAFLGKQVLSCSIETDPLWNNYAQWIIGNYNLRSCWSTPIVDGQGQVLGTFAMYAHTPREPIPSELALADICTRLAAIAIERNRFEAELVNAKERAEAASYAKNMFLANMGHELRTPLNAILGYSDLVKEELEDMGQGGLVKDVGHIQTSARNLLALIVNILDVVKLDAGHIGVDISPFDIGAFVDQLAQQYAPILEKKNNRLEVNRADDLGIITSDRNKVARVLGNLLNNANKFTHDGRIILSARHETTSVGAWVVISVEDTGIGMNEQQLARLFEAFFQGDASSTRKHEGTGLGLAISFRLCRLLKGTIEAQSALGKGSTFSVRLPITIDDQREQPATDAITQQPPR